MSYNKGRSDGKGSSGKKPYQGSGRKGSASYSKQSGKPTSKSSQGSRGSTKSPSGGKGSSKKKQYSATTRSVEANRREQQAAKRRRDLEGSAVNLPNWVIESVERTTPKDRIAPTLEALGSASEALADGKYQSAVKHGQRAKSLSPNDATIRETIGLAAYRLGDWQTALSELRAYRRIAGETTHLPIEMDVLRAQGRTKDVNSAWAELNKRGGHGLVMNEGAIVYASFLLDDGDIAKAWEVIDPGTVTAKPNEAHLRRYYVAARVAAAKGDINTAKKYSEAIVLNDPSFPGWDALSAEIARALG